MKPPHPEKYSFIPNCRATYHQIHCHPSVFSVLHLAERDYNYTLGSRKMIQLTNQEKTLSQPLDNIFQDVIFYIQDNKKEHITTIRSEAERVINRTLPVCRPLTEVMSVQHYRSYEVFLLGSRSSLVVFKEKSECT